MTASSSAAPQSNGYHNSVTGSSATLEPGIFVPTVAFFASDDSVDEETTKNHAKRLARAGVAGLVTHGSNGEAVHLDHAERKLITRLTRTALEEVGKANLPIIVGCGAQSTRETIQLCRDAGESGGTHALILPPSYYGGLLNTDLIIEHFRAVADASPVPLLIYNFPAPCGGLDLSSDTILTLAKHPNIVGVKLTCGNTGKLARVVAGTRGTSFRTYGGSADFIIQTLSVGGHGVIAGLANISPVSCNEVVRLWKNSEVEKAVTIQGIVARGDWAAIKGGFISVKVALESYYGYGGLPRKPCTVLEGKALKAQVAEFQELVELETKVSASA